MSNSSASGFCSPASLGTTSQRRNENDAHIPGLFNPGVLWDINNIIVHQGLTSWFSENGDEVRFWIHFTNRNRSTTGIHQVINNDEAFAIAFCVNQPVVASTILGATRLDQLESCLAGATLTWTEAMQTAVDDLQCVSKTMPRFPEDWARLVG